MGLDYVDIFYSHSFDPDTPLEETCGALASAVQQGKALYVGISSYSAGKTREAAAILHNMGIKALIHQPSYSLLNRWIEEDLLNALDDTGMGCLAFSALAQGLLTDKYLNGTQTDAFTSCIVAARLNRSRFRIPRRGIGLCQTSWPGTWLRPPGAATDRQPSP